MEREKSIQVGFRWKKELFDMVTADAKKNGVSMGAYLAMLSSQKHLEAEAMRLVSAIPPDKLRQMMVEFDERSD